MRLKIMTIVSIITQVLFAGVKSAGQTTPKPVFDSLNAGNAATILFSDGTSFWNPSTGLPVYRVPKSGKASSIFTGAMWIGGLDAGGKLHTAAETYKQNGLDFWPGPMMDSLDYSSHQDTVWNKVWSVHKSTIDSFRTGKCVGIPADIQNWPGDGNVAMGQMPQLAPYVDSDHNGYYDPAGGDYPLIRGDQALYMIFNDDRGLAHKETGGAKLGVEVHFMAYQFNTPSDSDVYNTTFLHYDIYNRSKNNYDSVYLGYFCDMDLGNGGNDYIGCDSANNFWYTYNGTTSDPDGTGQFAGERGYYGPVPPPPAQAVAYLCDTMAHFIYYNNDFSVHGNPQPDTAISYYMYLKDIWLDSTHVTYGGPGYGGSSPSNYMFSGNPATGKGWSEVSAGNPPGDRRGLSSNGPFTLNAGKAVSLDLALVFVRPDTGSNLTCVNALAPAVKDVRSFYNSQAYGCNNTLLSVNEPVTKKVQGVLYPNPFNSGAVLAVSTQLNNATLKVYDMLGREVNSITGINTQRININRDGMADGMYFYSLYEGSNMLLNGKFIIK